MLVILALAGNTIQLVPDGTLILHVLIIVAMVAILNRTLFRPINHILSDRQMQTEGGLAEAAAVVGRVREKIQDYERQLREARAQGYQLLEQLKLRSLRERDERLKTLKAEISVWVTEQKSQLSHQAEGARRDLEGRVHELGSEIAARILERPVGR